MQQDDHTYLVAGGKVWKIHQVRGHLVDVYRWTEVHRWSEGNALYVSGGELVRATLDLSEFDYEAYAATAVELMEAKYGP